jgi:hypothetical protein
MYILVDIAVPRWCDSPQSVATMSTLGINTVLIPARIVRHASRKLSSVELCCSNNNANNVDRKFTILEHSIGFS